VSVEVYASSDDDRYGFLVFTRKGKRNENGVSPSELVTEWFYRRIIQERFIPEIRKNDPNIFCWSKEMDVPSEFCAITKVDSEQFMMKIQKEPRTAKKDIEIGNTAVKIGAAATACYQPLDVCTMFPMLRKAMREHSSRETQLSRTIREELKKLEAKDILKCKNRNEFDNIVGITASCPEVLQPIITPKRIIRSYLDCGDLSKSRDGKRILPIPDLYAMMAKCNLNWDRPLLMRMKDGTMKNVGIFREYFESLIPLALEQNAHLPYIPESWFDGKFPLDMNTSGEEVAREPGRLDFSLHRAMILTDENNRLLIDEQLEKARRIAQENKLKEIMRYKTYYTNNEFCEERVRKLAKLTDDQTIQNVEKNIFQKITMKHLLGFVKVRDNKNITAPIDHLPSRKDGLVKMAFEIQNHTVIADQATIPALEVNDTLPEEDRLAHVEMPVDTSWSVTGDFVKKSFVVIATLDDDIAENAVAKMESLNDNILSKMLMLRFGVLLRYHKISLNHFTVNFVRKNIERACVILKLHELYPDDELLKYRQVEESLFKIDKNVAIALYMKRLIRTLVFKGLVLTS
jgi:hypothetical protein